MGPGVVGAAELEGQEEEEDGGRQEGGAGEVDAGEPALWLVVVVDVDVGGGGNLVGDEEVCECYSEDDEGALAEEGPGWWVGGC